MQWWPPAHFRSAFRASWIDPTQSYGDSRAVGVRNYWSSAVWEKQLGILVVVVLNTLHAGTNTSDTRVPCCTAAQASHIHIHPEKDTRSCEDKYCLPAELPP